MQPEYLTSAEVARLLGVGPTSVKRWADSGLLPCIRTPGKHRRFLRHEVNEFLKRESRSGISWSPDTRHVSERAELLSSGADVYAVQGALFADRSRYGSWWQTAEGIASAVSETERRRTDGEITASEEHEAVETLCNAVERCCRSMPDPENGKLAMLAVARDEEHTLALSLSELCLRDRGWKTMRAGRLVPNQDLLSRVESQPVDLVAISASATFEDPMALGDQAKPLLEICERRGIRLVLGGRASWPVWLLEHASVSHVRTFRELDEILSGSPQAD